MNTRQTEKEAKTGENNDDSPDNRNTNKKIMDERFFSSFSHTKIEEAQPVFTSMMTKTQNKEEVVNQNIDRPYSPKDGKQRLLVPDVPQMPIVAHEWYVALVLQPSYGYRMARTTFSVSLTDGTTVETITEKIFNSNKERSIHAEYPDDEALAKCKTRSFLKFHIRLFQGSEKDTVAIEVQRRSGCSLAFKEEYQALLQVFKGDSIPQVPMRKKLDLSKLNCLEKDLIPLPEGAIEDSLEISLKHLSSDMYDARMFALEDLIASTDSESCDISPKACQLILSKYIDIFLIVIDLICKIEDADDDEDDSFERFHCLALTLLRNISLNSSTDEKFIAFVSLSQDKLLQSLIRDIKMAPKYPWNACLATKCLSQICVNSPQAVSRITEVEDTVREALVDAKKMGEKCHQSLEQESNIALGIMNAAL